MIQVFLRYAQPLALGVVPTASVRGEDATPLLVFVSAFATGNEGGVITLTDCTWTPAR